MTKRITLRAKTNSPSDLFSETRQHSPKKSRNWRAEAERAQMSFFDDVADLRLKRDAGQLDEKWQVAQSLMLCGLPYDQISEKHWVRRARLADGSILRVTFVATEKDVPLPFGQDRGPLYFVMNKALKTYREIERELDADPRYALIPHLEDTELNRRRLERAAFLDQARFVAWKTATEYTTLMGKKGGSSRESLKDRLVRLRHCAISIVRETAHGDETLLTPIIKSSRMPRWAQEKKKGQDNEATRTVTALTTSEIGKPCGFEIGDRLFSDYVHHHVPVPEEVIIALIRRPKFLDLFVWLCWRVFAAKSDTFIPLNEIMQQIGSSDSNPRRILRTVKQVIHLAKTTGWEELRAEVRQERVSNKKAPSSFQHVKGSGAGIVVGPPRKGIHFAMSAPKQIVADVTPEDREEVRKLIQKSFDGGE